MIGERGIAGAVLLKERPVQSLRGGIGHDLAMFFLDQLTAGEGFEPGANLFFVHRECGRPGRLFDGNNPTQVSQCCFAEHLRLPQPRA